MNANFDATIRRSGLHAAFAAAMLCGVALTTTTAADARDGEVPTKVVSYADLNLNSAITQREGHAVSCELPLRRRKTERSEGRAPLIRIGHLENPWVLRVIPGNIAPTDVCVRAPLSTA